MPMNSTALHPFRLLVLNRCIVLMAALLTLAACPGAWAQTRESLQLSVDAYTRALEKLAPGEETVTIGDMR